MNALALGVVGYGIMGERLLRAAMDHDPAAVRVAGVWDPAPSAMARLADAFPGVPRLAGPDAVIAAADCVYVASPPATHLAHAEAAVAAGKAAFLEKPLAVDVAAARRFVAGAGDARTAVNFPFASSLAVARLAAWEDEGVVGVRRRLTIEVAFAAWPRPWQMDAAGWLAGRAQGGFTREVVSHFLFLARRRLGPLQLLSHAVDYPPGDGSELGITAELRAGDVSVRLAGRVGGTDKADHNLWLLEGDRGAIRLRDWSVAERREADGTWREAADAMANERARPLVLRRQLDAVAAMTRGAPHGLATTAEALDVQTVVEAILAG
ncbi:MAG: Gfo/Idh/MocA family oxidoreductase [Alphaproteobacteria bacterium]|nr:Gfo/Idh/MocA family oxidoreductase [Alphaproteobacteria bacterium]